MTEHNINSPNPIERVWAIREKIYEETKHMTLDERMAYTNQKAVVCRRQMQEIASEDCDLSWLQDGSVQYQPLKHEILTV